MNPWIVAGALVACIACWFGGQHVQARNDKVAYDAKVTQLQNTALVQRNAAVDAARAAEQAATREQTAIAARASARADELGRAADAARTSVASLQQRVTALLADAARRRADPAAPAAGPAAADTDLLLAGLLDKSLERNRQLAAFADDAHNRGAACERSYEAVRVALNGAQGSPAPLTQP